MLRAIAQHLCVDPLGDATHVREGESVLFTGFPIGSVLGLIPVTHRAMVSAITPIVMPAARADQLDARTVRRLQIGSFSVFPLILAHSIRPFSVPSVPAPET